MPTFFARRYARREIPRLEIGIGLIALLISIGIVAAFISSTGPADRKLFELDAQYLNAPSETPEMRMAAERMPAPPKNWRLAAGPVTLTTEQATKHLADSAKLFLDAQLVASYVGQYEPITGEGNANVAVYDMKLPQNAATVNKARMPRQGQALKVGCGGWIEGNQAGFWSGKYYTEIQVEFCDDPAVLQAFVAQTAAKQLRYGNAMPATATPNAAALNAQAIGAGVKATHFPQIAGRRVQAPTEVKRFNKETLYEKINGKAGVFLGFMFEELEFATYVSQEKEWPFDVYVYNMSEPVNAFGIYQTEQAPDAELKPYGREGYVSGSSVFFWKDKYYVNVLGPPDEPDAAEIAEMIAAGVDKAINDSGQPLWAEVILPQEHRKKNSFGYKASDALGYSFLKQVFVASYANGDEEYQLFITQTAGPEEARALLQKYATSVKVLGKETRGGGEIVLADALGIFEAAFAAGRYFGGVTECEKKDLAVQKAAQFQELLSKAPQGGASAPASSPAVDSTSESEQSGGTREPG